MSISSAMIKGDALRTASKDQFKDGHKIRALVSKKMAKKAPAQMSRSDKTVLHRTLRPMELTPYHLARYIYKGAAIAPLYDNAMMRDKDFLEVWHMVFEFSGSVTSKLAHPDSLAWYFASFAFECDGKTYLVLVTSEPITSIEQYKAIYSGLAKEFAKEGQNVLGSDMPSVTYAVTGCPIRGNWSVLHDLDYWETHNAHLGGC